MNIALTTCGLALCGNVDDRKPVLELLKGQSGRFFADLGYISKALALELRNLGMVLITKFKKKMNNKLMQWSDKQLLRRRAVVELAIEQLKHICHIEHSRHRSPTNFVANLFAGLIAYCEGDPVRVSRTWERARTRRAIFLRSLLLLSTALLCLLLLNPNSG